MPGQKQISDNNQKNENAPDDFSEKDSDSQE